MEQILKNIKDCFGCSACAQVCPKDTIEMKLIDGFRYAIIKEENCIDCYRCVKVCPAIKYENSNESVDDCYACANVNKDSRRRSSSGGVFNLLAEHTILNGGKVFGAAFDEDFQLIHIGADKLSELLKLQKSKYIQSDIGTTYIEIGKLLKASRNVLFVGTPCQVAGLLKFLEVKSVATDKLLTADLVCHGVPSNEVFNAYIKEILPQNAIIKSIDFRDKKYSWKNLRFSMKYELDNQEYEFAENINENIFMKGFLQNLYLRENCTNCPFTSTKRVADITIGDFWGIGSFAQHLDDDTGVSLILTNNAKGKQAFDIIKSRLQYIEKFDIEKAKAGNLVLYSPCNMHKNRDNFIKQLNKGDTPVIQNIADNIGVQDISKNVGIMNFHFSLYNFGALLVPYALSQATIKLGFNPIIINYIVPSLKEHLDRTEKNINFDKFRDKYLKISNKAIYEHELQKQLKYYSKIIVGSDQVWAGAFDYKYFLNWAYGNKTFISYAASFGHETLQYNVREKEYISTLLSRFDAVSVRETSGVGLCRDLQCRDATRVLDPTMLLQADDYNTIIDDVDDKSYIPDSEYVAYAFLDDNEKQSFLSQDDVVDKVCIDLQKDDNDVYRQVGEWVGLIKNASYVVTDSYHCVIFSIIFNKQFICYKRDVGGNARIESLFQLFNINPERFIHSWDLFSRAYNADVLDYGTINKVLEQERTNSYKYLLKALYIPANEKYRLPAKDVATLKIKNITIAEVRYTSDNKSLYLFNKILLYRERYKQDKTIVELFKFIPLLKIVKKGDRRKVYLFRFLRIGDFYN